MLCHDDDDDVIALEFAYTESPFAMQGMVMGMNHLTTGLGALLGSAVYNAVAVVTAAAGKIYLLTKRPWYLKIS